MTSTIPAKRKQVKTTLFCADTAVTNDAFRFGNVNTVALVVGANKTIFHVHEDTLYTASPVFKAAFESKFKEGTDRTMEMPDEDLDLVEMFVSWLYRNTLHDNLFELSGPDPEQRMMQTARLFVFADKYDLEALRLGICEKIFDLAANKENKVPSFAVLEYVYSNTQRKAIIRQIIADWFAWTDIRRWHPSGDESEAYSTSWLYNIPEFGVDLALALYNPSCDTTAPTPFDGSKLEYIQKFQKKKTSS